MIGVVYDPPKPGLPFLAVVLHNNEVVISKVVSSPVAGEAMIASVFSDFAKAKAEGKV